MINVCTIQANVRRTAKDIYPSIKRLIQKVLSPSGKNRGGRTIRSITLPLLRSRCLTTIAGFRFLTAAGLNEWTTPWATHCTYRHANRQLRFSSFQMQFIYVSENIPRIPVFWHTVLWERVGRCPVVAIASLGQEVPPLVSFRTVYQSQPHLGVDLHETNIFVSEWRPVISARYTFGIDRIAIGTITFFVTDFDSVTHSHLDGYIRALH